jgi:hypothetical protein
MSNKCPNCNLVNFAGEQICRRCGAELGNPIDQPTAPPKSRTRKIILRILLTPAIIVVILLTFYLSLIATSDPINSENRQTVEQAINVIEQRGFRQEAFMLRRLVTFRSTDNWWNRWLGHEDAYAATNFPFQVVTLYPEFFSVAADDVERAAILLHETSHLYGRGEEEATKRFWRAKKQLGWNQSTYGAGKVWKNVSEATRDLAPQFFQCGEDKQSDCFE